MVDRLRQHGDGSVLHEHCTLYEIRSNSVVRITHEVCHFRVPVPDGEDDYGRPRYVSLHRFLTLETGRSIGRLVAECAQVSRFRDFPPPESAWPIAVRSFVCRAQRILGAQVFQRRYLCDDPDFDLAYRWEVQGQVARAD